MKCFICEKTMQTGDVVIYGPEFAHKICSELHEATIRCEVMASWIQKARDLMVFNNLHDPSYAEFPFGDCDKFEELIDEAPI